MKRPTYRSTDIADIHKLPVIIHVSIVLFGYLVIVGLGTNALNVIILREYLRRGFGENGFASVCRMSSLTHCQGGCLPTKLSSIKNEAVRSNTNQTDSYITDHRPTHTYLKSN